MSSFGQFIMLVDAVALMLSVRCRSEIATKQLLRHIAETHGADSQEIGTRKQSPKTYVTKILALMKASDRRWVEELYRKF